ncbi:MAG: D-tyrosyl-tRNA(Tyr) deacylase [Candidatus Komeilibacteria bacterium RIFCSPLOWO2_02_FULL_48_11]|uniref:D-aminoacyl-tRNA deacylase n=1 Tax=Candidatus Komeilibacteria bacterium RIFCSPLOWO2_02_FULL_48_11 TaxID=1798553 RepID=A0A1G2BSZ2_9BACT|nr:MAG: D-tyrosyl-tRNA(Tyr) deacylase [Candidatus Komeilibacteria bacterium RIFCSPLOWO2_02_FULL_48_11]
MKAVLQRVTSSKVSINNKIIGQISQGFNILLGIGQDDSESLVNKFAEKIVNLRVFNDEAGKMNKSLLEIKGEVLLISQFTLCADTSGGHRPSFSKVAAPEKAEAIYQKIAQAIRGYGVKVETGEFGAYMAVDIANDGPVTIILDSKSL